MVDGAAVREASTWSSFRRFSAWCLDLTFPPPLPNFLARHASMAVATNTQIHPELIAPCGINCAVCKRYLAFTNKTPLSKGVIYCRGCRPQSKQCALLKPECRKTLRLANDEVDYCCDCDSYPCESLACLDKRYRQKYGISVIDNLEQIRASGLADFLADQIEKYACPRCGGLISVHDKRCYKCGGSTDRTR